MTISMENSDDFNHIVCTYAVNDNLIVFRCITVCFGTIKTIIIMNVPYKYSCKYANYYQQHSVITLIVIIGVTNLI